LGCIFSAAVARTIATAVRLLSYLLDVASANLQVSITITLLVGQMLSPARLF
jgi:hypothetical protein